eukprot:4487100-Amphidinium_carterae.2
MTCQSAHLLGAPSRSDAALTACLLKQPPWRLVGFYTQFYSVHKVVTCEMRTLSAVQQRTT